MTTKLFGLLFCVALAIGLAACGDTTTPGGTQDLAMPGGQDLAMQGGHDLAMPSGDLAMSSSDGGGLKALCDTCTQDSECASGSCLPYMKGTVKKCSHTCATATAATDCPGVNACNGMQICRCQ